MNIFFIWEKGIFSISIFFIDIFRDDNIFWGRIIVKFNETSWPNVPWPSHTPIKVFFDEWKLWFMKKLSWFIFFMLLSDIPFWHIEFIWVISLFSYMLFIESLCWFNLFVYIMVLWGTLFVFVDWNYYNWGINFFFKFIINVFIWVVYFIYWFFNLSFIYFIFWSWNFFIYGFFVGIVFVEFIFDFFLFIII